MDGVLVTYLAHDAICDGGDWPSCPMLKYHTKQCADWLSCISKRSYITGSSRSRRNHKSIGGLENMR